MSNPQRGAGRRLNKRKRRSRRLKVQNLEQRQLLAADVAMHNADMPEDVNADGEVTALDALLVINDLQAQSQPIEFASLNATDDEGGERPPRFRDVSGDGRVTPNDVLRILNRLSRDRRDRGIDGGDQTNRDRNDQNDRPTEATPTDISEEVRSIDGTGNNLQDATLGSAGAAFTRIVEADYADGIDEPSGGHLASAREISNIVFDQEESILNDRGLSDIVWQWGQFIDHDITLTGEASEDEAESFNIEVPLGDAAFDPFFTGEQEIDLTRSGVAEGTGIDSVREQINEITAFIDGSMVYGSDSDTAASLRSFEGGRLLTSENDLLPIDESGFFLAGDVRANEQHGLTAMHTLFVREHNRLANEIAAENPGLTDEEIYQEARATVIGEIQAITFNEYLPALLGRGAIDEYSGYDSTVDPSISNLFATAAFRYGHSALSSELQRLDDDGNVIDEGNILLRDAFFNPTDVLELGIDPLLKGLTSNVSQEIDTALIDDVREFLFGPPGAGGFDLAALNIQRGRDHGLPDYNSAREQLGLERAESFADITSDPELQAKLAEAYESVDDVDVWVGALAEDHTNSGSLGELASTVIADQFEAIRDGDRFWYQNTFSGQELRDIDRTRLSDVIERNTTLTSIQNNAFFVPDAATDNRRPNRDGQDGDSRGQDDGGRNDPPNAGPTNDAPAIDGQPIDNGPNNLPPPPLAPAQSDGVINDTLPANNPATSVVGDNVATELPPPPPPETQNGPSTGGQGPQGQANPNGQQTPEDNRQQRRSRRGGGGLDTQAVDRAFAELGDA